MFPKLLVGVLGLLATLALPLAPLSAKVLGTNPPARALTAELIATLPADQQPAWRDYLARSTRQRAADQALLADEIKTHHVTTPILPPKSSNARTVPLDKPAAWYGSADARRIADNVITFQTPAGGWSKNFDATAHPRAPGEGFSADNVSKFTNPEDNDRPLDLRWTYIGTFDNDATITQIAFLARVATALAATDATAAAPYRASVQRGIDYILAAQYPNGGWPQVYPLDGGYHDAITLNDGAMIHIMTLLRAIAAGDAAYAFVPVETRTRAAQADARALACLLAMQVIEAGRPTAWCQQHDLVSLAPTSARNYEMASLASGESAGIAQFLMEQPDPSPAVIAAVHGAAAWFEKTALRDVEFKRAADGSGRILVPAPGAGPLWPRYAELGTYRPLFGDRDKTIHDDVSEISKERRNGYAWFTDAPKRVLEKYAKWAKPHPAVAAAK